MRIGIFGGSFDPIHYGHLILAEHCREQAELDQVWFVPCADQPLKQAKTSGSDRQRVEMIEMAISGHDSFRLSRVELDRGDVSFTVDTLEQIREEQLSDELFWLMGDDSLESFSRWRDPERICELATPLVVNRPGSDDVDLHVLRPFVAEERFQQLQKLKIVSPQIEISSSELRERVSGGRSIRYLTPRAVEKYIETNQIYA